MEALSVRFNSDKQTLLLSNSKGRIKITAEQAETLAKAILLKLGK